MPLYEYECDACKRRFEVIQKFSDPPVEVCTGCGASPVRRLMSSPAIQFKGSGWYITDYSQKGKSGGESGQASKSEGDAKKGDAQKTDTPSSDGAAKTPAPASAPSGGKE